MAVLLRPNLMKVKKSAICPRNIPGVMLTLLLVAGAAVVGLFVFCRVPAPQIVGEPQTVNGLRLELEMERTYWGFGRELIAHVRMRNVSDRPIRYWPFRPMFDVDDGQGTDLRKNAVHADRGFSAEYVKEIPPGGAAGHHIRVTARYRLASGRQYTASAKYTNTTDAFGLWVGGEVRSNKLIFVAP